MSTPRNLTGHTKKIFRDTVDIYRNDLSKIVANPVPLVLALGGLIVFWLVVQVL